MLRFFFDRVLPEHTQYKRVIEHRFARLYSQHNAVGSAVPDLSADLILYQVGIIDNLSLELFLVANKSVHEEELLLSGTIGDYYARLQNFHEIHKDDGGEN